MTMSVTTTTSAADPVKKPSGFTPMSGRRRFTDGTVRVAMEKSGRGKVVTVVRGLPPAEVKAVAGELKRLCGAGGSVKDGAVELQGDHRAKIAAHLEARGLGVR